MFTVNNSRKTGIVSRWMNKKQAMKEILWVADVFNFSGSILKLKSKIFSTKANSMIPNWPERFSCWCLGMIDRRWLLIIMFTLASLKTVKKPKKIKYLCLFHAWVKLSTSQKKREWERDRARERYSEREREREREREWAEGWCSVVVKENERVLKTFTFLFNQKLVLVFSP